MFKATLCSSWEFVSMYHVLFSVMLSSAEGLVTRWVLVWWRVEAEKLCIAASSAGKGFLKQMVIALEQPAGPVSCWFLLHLTLSTASGFDFPICE